jgi:ADP-ribose pyrophosphatase
MPKKFEVTSKEIKYKSPWTTLEEYSIARDGIPGTYAVIKRSDASIVVASTSNGDVLLVKQYRFPIESYSWELPMGGIEDGEKPIEAASRELREETGLVAELLEVGSFRPVPGLSPQTAFVFSASIPEEKVAELGAFNDEIDEIVQRKIFSSREIHDMIESKHITDGYTISSLALTHLLS